MSAEKTTLRASMRSRREAVEHSEARAAAQLVAARLSQLEAFQEATTVGIYSSFRGELDPALVVEQPAAKGKRFCLPTSHRETRDLSFHHVPTSSNTTAEGFTQQLVESTYGILESPGPEVPLDELDVVVTPALAFDRAGFRLGWGGGYYDRLLAALGARVTTAVVGYEWQLVEQLSHEPHDLPVQWVITPSEAMSTA